MFPSMMNPKQLVKYICQIVDNGNSPRFVVTASDEPTTPFVEESPSKVWKLVVRRINTHVSYTTTAMSYSTGRIICKNIWKSPIWTYTSKREESNSGDAKCRQST